MITLADAVNALIPDPADRERILYWAHHDGIAPIEAVKQLLHRAARQLLEPVPISAPRRGRSVTEIRAEGRARSFDGRSAHTEAITLPKGTP